MFYMLHIICRTRTALTFNSSLSYYGGYPEIAQKAIEGANVTCRNMHVILRRLFFRKEIEFEAKMILFEF